MAHPSFKNISKVYILHKYLQIMTVNHLQLTLPNTIHNKHVHSKFIPDILFTK
jgi:hypothetical protein